MRTCLLVSAVIFAFASLAGPVVSGGVRPSTAGRLTCTVEGGKELVVGVTRDVSCTYTPASGVSARFQGSIGRFGPDADKTGKRVLVWLVFAPPGTTTADLEGRYLRTEPPKPQVDPAFSDALIGGIGGQIALQPPTGRDQIPGNAAITVLELNLKTIKV